MIRHPALLLLVLAGLVAGLNAARRLRPFRRLFDFLPVPFWCYVLPMAGASAGIFPAQSPLYGVFSAWVLPACLALLLVGADVRRLAALSRPALSMMAVGCGGIILGTVAATVLLKPWLPPDAWKSLGALAASWTGGSANMLAVKEALRTPEAVFAPVLVTDSLFAYAWMSLWVLAAPRAAAFDRWTRTTTDLSFLSEGGTEGRRLSLASGLLAAAALVLPSVLLGPRLPTASFLTSSTWTVLLATTGALLFSAAWGGRADARLEKGGTYLLFLLVASLGARATFGAVVRSPVFLAAGLVMLGAHGAAVLLAARFFKAPLALVATASQACVGGVASAPMVAAVYRPALAAAGLLMAILGNVLGTYLGLLTAHLCERIMG